MRRHTRGAVVTEVQTCALPIYLRRFGAVGRHGAAPVGGDLQPTVTDIGAPDDEDRPVRSAHFIDGAGAVEQLRAFQRAFDTAVFGGLARSARFRLGEIAIVRRTIAADRKSVV